MRDGAREKRGREERENISAGKKKYKEGKETAHGGKVGRNRINDKTQREWRRKENERGRMHDRGEREKKEERKDRSAVGGFM